jgi:hypothetical protein
MICNAVIHGHDQASHNRIHRTEAELEIRAIYNDRDLLLSADQDHLFDMLSFILLSPLFLSKTGSIPIKACLPTVSAKLRSARQKVLYPFEAISIRYKEKRQGPAYSTS